MDEKGVAEKDEDKLETLVDKWRLSGQSEL